MDICVENHPPTPACKGSTDCESISWRGNPPLSNLMGTPRRGLRRAETVEVISFHCISIRLTAGGWRLGICDMLAEGRYGRSHWFSLRFFQIDSWRGAQRRVATWAFGGQRRSNTVGACLGRIWTVWGQFRGLSGGPWRFIRSH